MFAGKFHILISLAIISATGSALSRSCLAAVLEAECSEIRKKADSESQSLFFQKYRANDREFYPLKVRVKDLADYVSSRKGARIRFVFFVRGDEDQKSTFFLVKQRYNLVGEENPWDFVQIYNNVRDQERKVDFKIYQRFHQERVEGPEYRTLTEWLHVGPGLFTRRDFLDSADWPRPRRFFAFDKNSQDGDELLKWTPILGPVA